MATPFRIKRSAVPGKVPQVADLQLGELALNTNDAELYTLRARAGLATDVVRVGAGATIRNVIYVTKDGKDTNTGKKPGDAKATIKAAVAIASTVPGSIIKVSAGTYVENNPIKVGPQVSIVGDSLREVTVVPQNSNQDLFHVAPGDLISDMSFTGTMNTGKAVTAFDPDTIRYSGQSPYLLNCTNFITNSIGMKIDGSKVIGPFKSFVCDSFTQYNQNGVGCSITNEGYAQLVSLFSINNDESIFCGSGGQCDITNSNSSFGNYGLVADGVGPRNFTGIVSATSTVNADTFTLFVDNTDPINITAADYDGTTGLTTITTASNHNFNVGAALTISGMLFTCDSAAGTTDYNVSGATYDRYTGILTVTTAADHDFTVGIAATLSNMTFSCAYQGGTPSNAIFPPAAGAGNGDPNHVFDVLTIPSSNSFSVNVGPSTISHTYVSGGVVAISTIASFPSGENGYVFSVKSVPAANQFTVHVGPNDREHTYVAGGTAEVNVVRPYDGQVVYFDECLKTHPLQTHQGFAVLLLLVRVLLYKLLVSQTRREWKTKDHLEDNREQGHQYKESLRSFLEGLHSRWKYHRQNTQVLLRLSLTLE
jgi:hypothetical protein